MNRLREKFLEFQNDRDILSEILDDYTADYSQTPGSTLKRQEVLREKYSKRVPKFSHLIWSDDDDLVWWTAADIAIVLGRDKSSVTRTLAAMERSEGWCSKLLALRHTDKAANGLTIYSYSREIFDLIVDRYEEEYLERFANPRHGTHQDITEVKRFWDYLKLCRNNSRMHIAGYSEPEDYELPDIPPMNWKDIFSLIWRKIFTVRTGTFFTVIFAVSFELARRWNFTRPFFLAGAAVILGVSAVLIRLRKWRIDVLADLGAGALLFSLLWTAGMTSGTMHPAQSYEYRALTHKDMIINVSSGWAEVYRLNDEVFVTVHPVLYSEAAGDTVTALEYGINSQPDKIIRRENFRDCYEKITSTKSNDIDYVTSRLIFTDKTRSEIRTSTLSNN